MQFRPLSARGHDVPKFDEPHEGVPDWLRPSLVQWAMGAISEYFQPEDLLRELERELRLSPHLNHREGLRSLLQDLVSRMNGDDELALNVVHYLVRKIPFFADTVGMTKILDQAGSVWSIVPVGEDEYEFVRRTTGPVADVLAEIAGSSGRAGLHLQRAWISLVGRNPEPSVAFAESVRAVEAAAKPVVSPNDAQATLGKMIGALRDAPQNWQYALNDRLADVIAMMDGIWKTQIRHGTDDPSAPLDVTQQQADAAFHVGIALVRIFAGGLLYRR